MSVRQKPNGKWEADVYALDGRRVRRTYRTKRSAEQAERHVLDARDRGQSWDDQTTLSMFLPSWEAITKPGLEEQTWKSYNGHVRKHIKPRLGQLRLHRVTTSTAQRLVTDLHQTGLSGETCKRVVATLSSILRCASRHGLARPLDQRQIIYPRSDTFRPRVPTIGEIERLADQLDPRISAAVPLAAYCGLRWGEVFGLEPGAIDWLGRQIHVRGSLRQTGGIKDTTKNGRDRRVVLPTRVADALSQHIAEHPHPRLVFHVDEAAIRSRWFYRAWAAAASGELDGITFHGLRHAAPTIMAEAGWSLNRVSLALGHSSPAFTIKHYGHLWPDSDERDRLALDALISAHAGRRMVAQREEATIG